MSSVSKRRAAIAALLVAALDSDSSSSSSSDDENWVRFAGENLDALLGVPERQPRTSGFMDVVRAYSDSEFRTHFLMSRATTVSLTRQFYQSGHYLENTGHGGCPQKSPEEHILSFLWYAVNNSCIREVARRFDTSESTLHRNMDKVLCFLCSLSPRLIAFPSDLDLLAGEFQKVAGFPGVVGSMGGTHVNVRCPAHRQRPVSTDRELSLAVQAVSDPWLRFLDVFVGPPGDKRNMALLSLSPLGKRLESFDHRYHLLTDVVYPPRECLVPPYGEKPSDDPETLAKQEFDALHGVTHAVVDDALALVKRRFRQLSRLEFFTLEKMSDFVLACCVLHNFLVDADDVQLDPVEESTDMENGEEGEEVEGCDLASNEEEALLEELGELKRLALRKLVVGA
ncbi:protein ALP1-like [Ixodes scapularis]|uniref:Putative transposase n=1 Tax=Ixodes scapularis TaxID=6945 RepID=A0A4D5RPC4_IXOSC